MVFSIECDEGALATYKQPIAPIVCVIGLYWYFFYGTCFSKFLIHKINLVLKEVFLYYTSRTYNFVLPIVYLGRYTRVDCVK